MKPQLKILGLDFDRDLLTTLLIIQTPHIKIMFLSEQLLLSIMTEYVTIRNFHKTWILQIILSLLLKDKINEFS